MRTKFNFRLLKIQRVIFNAETSLKFFTSNHFDFSNSNFIDLDLAIPTREKKEFSTVQSAVGNLELCRATYIVALQEIFKESVDDLPKARRRYFYVVLITRTLHTIMFFIGIWISRKIYFLFF